MALPLVWPGRAPLVWSDWMMERKGLKYISVSISLICVCEEICGRCGASVSDRRLARSQTRRSS